VDIWAIQSDDALLVLLAFLCIRFNDLFENSLRRCAMTIASMIRDSLSMVKIHRLKAVSSSANKLATDVTAAIFPSLSGPHSAVSKQLLLL